VGGGVLEIPLVSIISDNDSAGWAVATVIRSAGFGIEMFASAEKFLLSDQMPRTACLIVDVQLTGMSGLQLQTHLAGAGRYIPMVFVVGSADERARALAIELGAVNVLDKSFGDRALLTAIHSILKPKEPRRD
jgi:two-component system, LuxR family, response regulator FixJ